MSKEMIHKCLRMCMVLSILVVVLVQSVSAAQQQRKGFSYIYPKTYEDWQNAFLAGNGKMGIMVFGDPLNETVIFNDRGFNMAASHDRSFNEVPKETLDRIKQLCAEEKFQEGNKLAVESSGWKDGGEGSRHPGFKMTMQIPQDGVSENYSRVCNFETGEIIVDWTDNRGQWTRKSFVSRKDNVIVQEITAPAKGTFACSIELRTDPEMGFPGDMKFTRTSDETFLMLKAKYPGNTKNAGYEGVTRFKVTGGSLVVKDNVLQVSNAKSVLLLTRTKRYYSDCENEWNKNLIQTALNGIKADYTSLLKDQRETHQAIFNRVKLDLDASEQERSLSNEQLLAMQKDSKMPVKALWERIFDAGRCYYLSSSSQLTPPDLLGIWTGNCNAGWGGYYHLDANLNLQISGGNIGDMPEAMEGYFNLIETWKKGLQINAKKLLGCRGMLSCGNSPGLTSGLMASISDYYPYHYKTGEMAWLLYPFWEYYLITGDVEFLKNRLYPLLREMGWFYEDFLTLKDKNGNYIYAASISPENQPTNIKASLLNNSSFDIAGARFALMALVESSRILGVDEGVEKWTQILQKLPPYLVNSDGALQEWSWPGIGESYGHRHSSGLIMIWPYRDLTPESNPTLFNAARETLVRKDRHLWYENAGHGLLHASLIAAGLKNPESLNDKLLQLTGFGYYFDSLASAHYAKRGTFCTDVCNSMPGIMMEMLISSNPGVLELLPALPKDLQKGSVMGVKGRSRLTVEKLTWDMSQNTVNCTVRSDIDQDLTLIERNGIKTIDTRAKTSDSPVGSIARVVRLLKGETTSIRLTLCVGDN